MDEEREVIDPEVVDDGDGPRSGYEKYGRHFSEGGFWAKTAKVALRAGAGLVEKALVLYYVMRDEATPLWAKAAITGVLGYFILPIDLIPDFIPVLGCVDDLLLLPGMIWLAIRLIPAPVLQQCRDQADLWIKTSGGKPTSRIGAVLVVAVWMGAGLALWHWLAA